MKIKRITWTHDEELQCAILGGQGFSTKMICERTGLSPFQVAYRLKKGAIKRADYRNGNSDVAEQVLSRTARLSDAAIRDILNLKIIK
jgi:hypothetical protein